MGEIELRYVTKGEMGYEQIQHMLETVSPLWSKKRIAMLTVVYAACLLICFISDYYLGNWKHVCVVVAIGIAYLFVMWVLTKRNRKKRKQAFLEQYPDAKLAYENGFADDGLHIHNLSNGAHVVLSYDVHKKLVAVDELWVLVSHASVCAPIFAVQLSETDQESLLALLKEKNPKIKIDLTKKK